MDYALNKLKNEHADWYDIITHVDHGDVLAYYDLCYAAMSNIERAQKALAVAFPGCRNAIADWEAIASACAGLMTDQEVESSSNKSMQILNSVRLGGPAAAETYERIVDHATPRLRTLRVSAGLTQQALADASHVNIRQIQKAESGNINLGNLSLRNAVALADALGVDVRALL